MTTYYGNKDNAVSHAKDQIGDAVRSLHPTHRAEALREVETWSGDEAAKQESTNENQGVPEFREAAEREDDGDFLQ